jgi:hypothetical protein
MDERPHALLANPFVGMAGVVQVLLPQLTPALLAPEVGPALLSSAQRLAPVRQGGFECRLSAQDIQVDVQQYIQKRAGQLTVLRAYLASRDCRSRAWGLLRSLVNAWADETSPLSAGVEEIWIELDNDGKGQDPIVFVGLAPEVHGDAGYTVAKQALALLFEPDGQRSLLPALRRCFEVYPAEARIGHIGIMLGRGAENVRVNVKGLFPNHCVAYLGDVGWSGSMPTFVRLHEELALIAERATLCLDLGPHIQPGVALECSLTSPSRPRLWWATLLEFLIEAGLCTPAKRAAVLQWPGFTSALQSDTGWPVDLIAESLLQAPDRFGLIRRAISHIKVTVHTGARLDAKAYLWFNHEWTGTPPHLE